MKEFIKDFLILLSTPLYIIGVLLLVIFALGVRCAYFLKNYMNEWIDFMKDDYKKVYEVIKNGSKQR